jgi:proteasome lid subunit RPN8/RPN11
MSWLNRFLAWLGGKRPRLCCARSVWQSGAHELALRTRNGTRESGAFLLGTKDGQARHIERFVYYDDLDPNALKSRIVTFDGTKYPRLWDICEQTGLVVVADVHVHPGGYAQSTSDREQPAMPRAGHIAIILPHFARRRVEPGHIGIYEYLGNQRWTERTREGSAFFCLEP